MSILHIEIIEPKVLSIMENLESMNLIKITSNGQGRPRKTEASKITYLQVPSSPCPVPVTLAEEPDTDWMDGFGIWEKTPITPEELRKNAWGDRL